MRVCTCRSAVAVTAVALAAAVPPAAHAAHPATPFDVEFTDCVESIGVGLAPVANVVALTPAPFIPVGALDPASPVSPVVVRTADCEGIAVDGRKPKRGSIVQVGAVIVPPDFHGDINNYTFWYYTTDEKLAQRLQDLGVSAQHVEPLRYDLDPGFPGVINDLTVVVPRPGDPRFMLDGTVKPTTDSSGSFEAIWWQKTSAGSIRMDTSVPTIAIATGPDVDMTLTTDPASALGKLIGGATLPFVAIQQFNLLAAAHMHVTAGP